jgi:hypothetical protein
VPASLSDGSLMGFLRTTARRHHWVVAWPRAKPDRPIRRAAARRRGLSLRMVQTCGVGLFSGYTCYTKRCRIRFEESSVKLLRVKGFEVVGAKGFEPSTSWSRTMKTNSINALSSVAYGTRGRVSPPLIVRNLSVAHRLGAQSIRLTIAGMLPK